MMPTHRRFGALLVTACLISTLFLAFTTVNSSVDEPILTSRTTAYFSGVERTWNALANGLASNPARWDPVGVPALGDNITFDGSSTFTCNWNVEVTLGDFSMLAGYTGTVTQTADFGCVDFTVSAGTFTGALANTITSSGNVSRTTPGTMTENRANLNMVEDGTYITGTPENLFATIVFNANCSITGQVQARGMTINEGITVTIASGVLLIWRYMTSDLVNNGIIEGEGTGSFTILAHYVDHNWNPGVINAPVFIDQISGSTDNRVITLSGAGYLEGLNIDSAHASYTTTLLHGDNYTLTVSGAVTLEDRAIMTQGTGAWSFGSYAQTGVSSVFNQGGPLTIGDDFTVSDGIFHALGDMTVPGDWDTATGDYVNDDNVVTLTGASKTLAMHADDSFFNVTVSGSYTMNTDTTVRLRATITGTVDGTGDFLEPEPEFTSIPWVTACPETLYEYAITQTYWDELALDDAPYWLGLYNGVLKGIPSENETGLYNISLTLTWNDMATYQNFTLVVCAEEISPYQLAGFELAIALCFCFGIMLAGFKERMLLIMAGFVWMVCGIAIFIDYGDAFLYVSVGLGAALLFKGAYDVWK